MKFIFSVIILATIVSAKAAEVDSFRLRYQELPDSLLLLNKKANELMVEAVREANKTHFNAACSEKRLYKKLRSKFRNHYLDKFSKWIINTDQLAKIETKIGQSIYRDFSPLQSPIQGAWARVANDPTAAALNVNGHRIGTDKFEHFMGSGFNYFKTYVLEGKPLEEALNIGWKAETGIMGGFMTGVMAYGDLVANFQGMRFWNHVLQTSEDVLGKNEGPYIVCEKDQWTQIKKIDFSVYIDAGFDEGINCSKMRTQKMTRLVQNRLKEYQAKDPQNRSFDCPIDQRKLDELVDHYGELTPWLINEKGLVPMPK